MIENLFYIIDIFHWFNMILDRFYSQFNDQESDLSFGEVNRESGPYGTHSEMRFALGTWVRIPPSFYMELLWYWVQFLFFLENIPWDDLKITKSCTVFISLILYCRRLWGEHKIDTDVTK